MIRLARWLSLVAVLLLPPSAAAQSPGSRCADCHFAQVDAPAQDHLYDWDRSAHALNGIGCESCHGGNAELFEPTLAHRGILHSSNRRSPVHRTNLPATCGSCHTGPFVAFQESRHYQLLKRGNELGPTCSTCHDAVAGRLLSAAGLERQCASCHGANEVAPRAERAKKARQMYEALDVVREQLKLAHAMIRRVDDPQRRADLLDAYDQARVPLTRAINAGHQFVYKDLEDYLRLAQERVEGLMMRIANPAN
jgi:nitrate/TMAO reductase-like tetraheme cytochrome c subunit